MDLQNSLMQIGFSEYEAKVYLALLADHPVTGYQVSKNSGVPRSMVYEVLSRLSLRGAVLESIEGRATLYRPLPPTTLLEKHEQELQQLMSGLRPGLEEIYHAEQDDRTWSIQGWEPVIAYAIQMLRQAKQEVYLVLNDDGLDALQSEIEGVAVKNVQLNVLLTGSGQLKVGQVTHHPQLESELHGLTDTLLMVVDSREMLVTNSRTRDSATITNNNDLVMIARQFVWMEFFARRISSQLSPGLLQSLDPQDRQILES